VITSNSTKFTVDGDGSAKVLWFQNTCIWGHILVA
jgi:hypothetical protein